MKTDKQGRNLHETYKVHTRWKVYAEELISSEDEEIHDNHGIEEDEAGTRRREEDIGPEVLRCWMKI